MAILSSKSFGFFNRPKRRKAQRKGIAQPAEQLEIRKVLSATVSGGFTQPVTLNNGELKVTMDSAGSNGPARNLEIKNVRDTIQVIADGRVIGTYRAAYIRSIVVDGTNGNDVINASNLYYSVPITVNGRDGNDKITGGIGNDTLNGGAGNDTINGGYGDDIINGGTGNDTLNGGAGNDKLYGESGNDILDGGSGTDLLRGGDGNDHLSGGIAADSIYGDAGNDTIMDSTSIDMVFGGSGVDMINGQLASEDRISSSVSSSRSKLSITDIIASANAQKSSKIVSTLTAARSTTTLTPRAGNINLVAPVKTSPVKSYASSLMNRTVMTTFPKTVYFSPLRNPGRWQSLVRSNQIVQRSDRYTVARRYGLIVR